MAMETPEVIVKVRRNGVFLYFPLSYMSSRFGAKLPNVIRLTCGGKEVEAKLYMIYKDMAQYRVFAKYALTVLDSDECVLNT
jgi:hypothetical protein